MIVMEGTSGTDGKCDCAISIYPHDSFSFEYKGANSKLYSTRTEAMVREVFEKYGVKSGKVLVEDRGALQFVLRARLECAVERALGEKI